MVKTTRIILFVFLVMVSIGIKAQDSFEMIHRYTSTPVFDYSRNPEESLMNFVYSNIKIDSTINSSNIIYVTFYVDSLGYTSRHDILNKDVDSILHEEIIRACKLIKFKKPAFQNDNAVGMDYYLPINLDKIRKYNDRK